MHVRKVALADARTVKHESQIAQVRATCKVYKKSQKRSEADRIMLIQAQIPTVY